jgi:hypothetical protein
VSECCVAAKVPAPTAAKSCCSKRE